MQNAVFDLRQNCNEDSSPEKLDNYMTKTAKKRRDWNALPTSSHINLYPMNKSSATKIGIFFYSAKSCPSNHSAIICSMYSSILRVTGIPACLIVVAFFLVTGETDKDICTLFSSGWMRGLPALALFPPLISCGFMGRLPSPVDR
jgi:hypothetical protein